MAEIIGDGLDAGKHTSLTTGMPLWDNIHIYGAGGNSHATTPGAFHAVHCHWRWGAFLAKPNSLVTHAGEMQFKGKGFNGALVDPRVKTQDIKFAIVARDRLTGASSGQSSANFEDFFKKLSLEPRKINSDAAAGGQNSVVFLSSKVYPESKTITAFQGAVFIQGIFFGHDHEPFTMMTGRGTDLTYYKKPGKPDPKKWIRNPKVP